MKNLVTIFLLFATSFTYAQIATIKVQGSGGSGSVGTQQQVFNTESGGSILTKIDTFLTAGFGLRMLGTSGTSLIINNTAGTGLNITAVAGINVTAGAGAGVVASSTGSTALSGSSVSSPAVQGTSTNTFGGNFISTNGYAIHGITSTATTTFATMNLERSTAVTNTILPLIQIQRSTSGTAANGIGTSMEFFTEVSDGQNLISNTLQSIWTGATVGTRTSQFNITGVNSAATETFANFQTGSIVIIGNGADTVATKDYARSVGGSGGGNTIYTGDDTLTSDRIVELDGRLLQIQNSGENYFYINPTAGSETARFSVRNFTDDDNRANYEVGTTDIDAHFLMNSNFNDGVKETSILGFADATTSTITHTADSIAFNSTLSGTSNGYVWTLANSALGTGYWAAASSGTVTSVSGTTNRITSTGGATPVIDISGSYVGQSSITTLGTITTGTWNGSLLTGTYGGTGINNGSTTLNFGAGGTLGSNAFTSTAYAPIDNPTFTTTITTPSASITGTAGAGFIQIANQSSAPSTPTTSGRIYFNNTNALSWIGTNGFIRTVDGTANTTNRTYTLPDSSGTVALMIDSPQHVYAPTATFTAGTAPSGSANHSYQWTRVGRMVTLRINLLYGTAGATVTVAFIPLPADCPVPALPTGYATNDYTYIANGTASTASSGAPGGASRATLFMAATPEIRLILTSGSYKNFFTTLQYFTN